MQNAECSKNICRTEKNAKFSGKVLKHESPQKQNILIYDVFYI